LTIIYNHLQTMIFFSFNLHIYDQTSSNQTNRGQNQS